jgi:hypothetical protein
MMSNMISPALLFLPPLQAYFSLVGTTPLSDREGVYSVRQLVTYEKELRLADEACDCPGDSAKTLIGV